jgi:PKD repeat protein
MRVLMQIRDWFIQVLTWIWNLLFPKANRPPIAAFTATPTTGAVPFEVVYDASASSDPEGALSSFAWDFGDGQGGTGVRITHSYITQGSYTITLTVTDAQGASSSGSQTVIALHTNQPPVASFTVVSPAGGDPLSITCDASASSDPDGTIATYAWDFGDGQGGTDVTVIHRYASAGKYVVTLTVTDNEGASSSASQTITISGVMVPPDPTTVAPALDQSVVTSLAASTEFLYIGDAPIQTGVASGTIIPTRAAVLKGRVINRDGTRLQPSRSRSCTILNSAAP